MTRSLVSSWHQAPKALRKPSTRRDNIALIPASELQVFATWQQRAQQLPAGVMLLVLPDNHSQLQEVGRQISLSLDRRGRRSTIATI